MAVNAHKTKVLSFTRSHSASLVSYNFNDKVLVNKCSSQKYFDVNLKLWPNLDNSHKFLLVKSLFIIRLSWPQLKMASLSIKQLSCLTFIRFRPVWSPWQHYLTVQLEAIQNGALRYIFSKNPRFTNVTYLRANLHSLQFRRSVSRLTLFHKMYYYNASIKAALLLSPHITFPHNDNPTKFAHFQLNCVIL